MKDELLPHAKRIFDSLIQFQDDYGHAITPHALVSLREFTKKCQLHFSSPNLDNFEKLKFFLPAFGSFRSELTYHLSDTQATAKRLTERAFIHLQRSIVVDSSLRERWGQAFRESRSAEVTCEQLGALHLLQHGIWAFKVDAKGGRTDLVLGEPLMDTLRVESAAEALVLTEWKVVQDVNKLQSKANEAIAQASKYGSGVLAGFELTEYRYLVMVSEKKLRMPDDFTKEGTRYHHINISVDPDVPSKVARKRTTKRKVLDREKIVNVG